MKPRLGLAALALALCLTGCSGSGEPAPVLVEITEEGLEPAVVRVPAGTQVRWINRSVTIRRLDAAGPPAWQSGPLYPGEVYTRRFETGGAHVYGDGGGSGVRGIVEVHR